MDEKEIKKEIKKELREEFAEELRNIRYGLLALMVIVLGVFIVMYPWGSLIPFIIGWLNIIGGTITMIYRLSYA